MSNFQINVSEEERDAFNREFETQGITGTAYAFLASSCMPAFVAGYRAAKEAIAGLSEKQKEQKEASAKLAADLGYPNAWNVAAYPTVEFAAIEALDAAKAEVKAFAKRLTEPAGVYTMDQMRDYADAVATTRMFSVIDALDQKIRSLRSQGHSLHNAGRTDNSSAFDLMASELDQIFLETKRLGRVSFQKRAMYWGKKCFGLTLAEGLRERTHRFGEEAIELCQAFGMTKRAALGAVEYVYGRPVGEKRQEVGGVYTTLAMLCEASGIDMVREGERDLLEIDNEKSTTNIRLKRQGKPDFGEIDLFPAKKFLDLLKALPGQHGYMLRENGSGLSPNGEERLERVKEILYS